MSFQFKQFSVDDSNCAMKIGTDGCLLGAWADVSNAESILDIGTGSGIVALMLVQRNKNAFVDAIEIDNEAHLQSKNNFLNSPWNKNFTPIHSAIQTYVKNCHKKYDLIVSCPPYFVNSMKSTDQKRKLARHTDSLQFEELIAIAKRLLSINGKFSVIIPFHLADLFKEKALIEGFYITKSTNVYPREKGEPMRILFQMENQKKECHNDSIAILEEKGNLYTSDYKELTKEFYINF